MLGQAVDYALSAGMMVDLACVPVGDSSIPKLRRKGVVVIETLDPNNEQPKLVTACSDNIAFSINNNHILRDDLLSSGISFFNIHNGLVQKYRGIAEICIFAALCRGEDSYGVTLHQLLPGENVDSGPVVAQLEFNLSEEHNFADVLSLSLKACQKVFEDNVASIVSSFYLTKSVAVATSAFTYKDLPRLRRNVDERRLKKASDTGAYEAFFPRLSGKNGFS